MTENNELNAVFSFNIIYSSESYLYASERVKTQIMLKMNLKVCVCMCALITIACAALPLAKDAKIPNLNLPSEFNVKAVISVPESDRIFNMQMFYSKSRNLIRTSFLDQGKKSDMYYVYADNQILRITYSNNRASCVATTLSTSPDAFIVGGGIQKAANDFVVPDPLTVFHFHGIGQFKSKVTVFNEAKLTGQATVRGIDVNAYESSQQWVINKQNNLTLKVIHYFTGSNAKNWSFPFIEPVPLRVELKGSGLVSNTQINSFHHVYDFFDFQATINPLDLETPAGTYCVGRKIDKPFDKTKLPSFISFGIEQINHMSSSISYTREMYDLGDGYATSTNQKGLDPSDYINGITNVLDFNTGIAYSLDTQEGSCAGVTNISALAGVSPFFLINKKGKAIELDPSQFFFADGVDFQYMGQRIIQGVITDVWVGLTSRFEGKYGTNKSVIEWYMASPNHLVTWNTDSTSSTAKTFPVPMKFKFWPDIKGNVTKYIEFTFYDVDFSGYLYDSFDISVCYPNKPSNHFMLAIKDSKDKVTVKLSMDAFKFNTAKAIAQAAKISSVRVTNMKLYFSGNDTVIDFEIMDAPYNSTDKMYPGGPVPISLAKATANLVAAVKSNTLAIKTFDPKTAKFTVDATILKSSFMSYTPTKPKVGAPPAIYQDEYEAQPEVENNEKASEIVEETVNYHKRPAAPNLKATTQSLKQPSKDDDGYSGGAMAGLGIAMLVIGAAGGALGGYKFL